MKRVSRQITLAAALCASAALGCAQSVTLATERPIEIKIDLTHEVRVKLDREVEELVSRDVDAAAVAPRVVSPRGLREDLPTADPSEVRAEKRAGTIGECSDGYLDVVPPGSDPTRALVGRVNAERRARYEELARQYAAPLQEVEKLAAARRLTEAETGEFVMTPDGAWVTKDESLRVVVSQ